jgi:hypothetical protein
MYAYYNSRRSIFVYFVYSQIGLKNSTPVYFPATLSPSILQPGDSGSQYRLRAVMVHSGSATGGHYKVYIFSKENKWFEFNDSIVTELSAADVTRMFWFLSPGGVVEEDIDGIHSVCKEAYMLVYEQQTLAGNDVDPEVPQELAAVVQVANERVMRLKRAYDVHRVITCIRCFKVIASGRPHVKVRDTALPPVSLCVPSTKSIKDLHEELYTAFVTAGVLKADSTPINMTRLRHYDPEFRRVGSIVTDKEERPTLAHLGVSGNDFCLALEVLPTGVTFADLTPSETSGPLFGARTFIPERTFGIIPQRAVFDLWNEIREGGLTRADYLYLVRENFTPSKGKFGL